MWKIIIIGIGAVIIIATNSFKWELFGIAIIIIMGIIKKKKKVFRKIN